MDKVLAFVKQPSTLRGLVAIAGAFGLAFTEVQSEAVISAIIGIVGAIEVFRNEDKDA